MAKNTEDVYSGKDAYMLPVDGLHIYEWHPEKDGKGDPTEVHLIIEPTPDVALVFRFKSKRALNKLIAALTVHGQNVFGPD